MPVIDGRPPLLDAWFRPGNTFTVELTWPAGELAGRSFTATLDAATALTVAVDGDTMTVTATEAQTTALGAGRHTFVLTETTGGVTEEVIVGTWVGTTSARASASASAAVTVNTSAATVNVSVTGTDARYHKADVLVPAGWGEAWRTALAEADTRPVHAVVLGDSIGVGWRATDWWDDGFVGLLRAALQGQYGNGGRGFVTCAFGRNSLNNLISGFSLPTTGSWTGYRDVGGINGVEIGPATDGNGATMTWPVDVGPAGTITIYSRTDPTYGRYDYSLDGGGPVQVPQNLAAAVHQEVISTTPGSHTLQITAAAGQCRIYGARGADQAAGVVVHNMSLDGRQIDDLSTLFIPGTLTSSLNASLDFSETAPDLGIVALGVNDMTVETRTETELVGWLNTILGRLRGGDIAAPGDLVVVIQHRGSAAFGDAFGRWPFIVGALRGVADLYGAAVVDMWGLGGRTAAAFAPYIVDNAHPNDAGHAVYAAPLIDLLIP